MPPPVFGQVLPAAILVAALGCNVNDDERPPPPPECADAGCIPRPGGGTGGGITVPPDGGVVPDANADVDGGTITVTYAVQQTVDSWFYATSKYPYPVTVRAVGWNGQVAPATDAGTALPETVPDVLPGPNWFFVEDATGTRRVTGTLQLAVVDAQSPLAMLRAIGTDGISNLIVDQVLWAPPAATATLILHFRRAGRGVAGVTVKRDALPAGTTVAYDSSGMYVSDAMVIGVNPATDVEGTAIVRDIAGTQPFPALTSATLRYTLANSTTSFPAIEAKLARDAVTWMSIDVP
jgi:hypothetical protein